MGCVSSLVAALGVQLALAPPVASDARGSHALVLPTVAAWQGLAVAARTGFVNTASAGGQPPTCVASLESVLR